MGPQSRPAPARLKSEGKEEEDFAASLGKTAASLLLLIDTATGSFLVRPSLRSMILAMGSLEAAAASIAGAEKTTLEKTLSVKKTRRIPFKEVPRWIEDEKNMSGMPEGLCVSGIKARAVFASKQE